MGCFWLKSTFLGFFSFRHKAEAKPSYDQAKKEETPPSPAIVAHVDDAGNNVEEDGDAADVGDAEDDVERSLPRLAWRLTKPGRP